MVPSPITLLTCACALKISSYFNPGANISPAVPSSFPRFTFLDAYTRAIAIDPSRTHPPNNRTPAATDLTRFYTPKQSSATWTAKPTSATKSSRNG